MTWPFALLSLLSLLSCYIVIFISVCFLVSSPVFRKRKQKRVEVEPKAEADLEAGKNKTKKNSGRFTTFSIILTVEPRSKAPAYKAMFAYKAFEKKKCTDFNYIYVMLICILSSQIESREKCFGPTFLVQGLQNYRDCYDVFMLTQILNKFS